MTGAIIVTLCVLVLLAYFFDISSSKSKIPSVVLLLAVGFAGKIISEKYNLPVPNLRQLLPVLGTIGLILIVLEGSLELELNRSKLPLVKRSFYMALFPLLGMAVLLAFIIFFSTGVSFKDALATTLPVAVISSSVAIPSVKGFDNFTKEFVTYESSMSDILGVVLFNFFAISGTIGLSAVGNFLLQMVVIIVISFLATVLLSYMLSRIEHSIKFMPIIMLVILIYEISKILNLPSLVFIMVFGLFLGNLDELNHNKWIHKLRPYSLNAEVKRFHHFISEIAFLSRALFFIVFGFLIDVKDLLDTKSLAFSLIICAAIFLIRWLFLRVLKLPIKPLIFVAPRGLINILLFLSLPASISVPFMDNAVMIKVIVITAIILMAGSIFTKKKIGTPAEQQTI